jgi:hypothetical protein
LERTHKNVQPNVSNKKTCFKQKDLQLVHDFFQVALGVFSDNFNHLLADTTNLSGLCVASLLCLVLSPGGKSNHEDTKGVAIRGADINISFDQRLPFLDQRALLVASHLHAVKVSHAIISLHIITR